jgi:hypothetical protein
MKILIVHDEYGNICSVAIASTIGERRAGLRIQRGEFVTEVEAESVDPAELRRDPREFCEKFRLDGASGMLLLKNG